MTKSEQNFEDLKFITEELNELFTWSFDELKVHWENHPEDKFEFIPLKDGSHLNANAAIGQRFRDLAERNSENDHERSTYDRDSYVAELKKEFVHWWFELKRPFDRQSSDRLVGKALAKLKKQREETTQFIPCEFISRQNPPNFKMGEVTFHSVKKFSEQHMETLQAGFDERKARVRLSWQKNAENGVPPIIPGQTLEDVLATHDELHQGFKDFYLSLGWIAEVTVPPCLPDISFTRAKNAVNAALDALKLFIGPNHGARFRIAYDKGREPNTSVLTKDEEGRFHTGWTFGGVGAQLSEGWFEELQSAFPMELKIVGNTVSHLLDSQPSTPLSEKWLGALLWYGDGVIESSHAARLIKYVAALEQLTITRTHNDQDLGKTVTDRTKLLCGKILEQDETGVTHEVIDSMYRLRCDLMHGRILPNHQKVLEASKHSGRIAQQALFSGLRFFLYVVNERRDSLEELERAYGEYIEADPHVNMVTVQSDEHTKR